MSRKKTDPGHNTDSTEDTEPRNDAEFFCKRGVEKFNEGDYVSAIADFDKALAMDPENAEYYNLRGHAKFSKGESKSAKSDFSKSKKLKAKGKKIKKIIPL